MTRRGVARTSARSRQSAPREPGAGTQQGMDQFVTNYITFYTESTIYKTFYTESTIYNQLRVHLAQIGQQLLNDRNVLFNDALSTFYLYGVRHMVKDHSDSERGNLLLPHGLLLSD